MAAQIDPHRCERCGDCVEVCPNEAITLTPQPTVERIKCCECALCVEQCPKDAITM